MNNAADNGENFGTALAFLGLFPIFVVFFVWFICAVIAAAIAADRNRSSLGFFCLTFFLLGPLGVAVAVLATRGEMDSLPPAPESGRWPKGVSGSSARAAGQKTISQTPIRPTTAGAAASTAP